MSEQGALDKWEELILRHMPYLTERGITVSNAWIDDDRNACASFTINDTEGLGEQFKETLTFKIGPAGKPS